MKPEKKQLDLLRFRAVLPKTPAPLLPIALGIMLGIIADNFLAPPVWIAIALAIVGVLSFFSRVRRHVALHVCLWRRRHAGDTAETDLPDATGETPVPHSIVNCSRRIAIVALVLVAGGLGILRHAVAFRRLPDNHVVFFTDEEPILAKLRGRIVTAPRIVEPDADRPRAFGQPIKTRFVLDATQVAGKDRPIPVVGRVTVNVKEPALALRTGDLVEMTGWVYRPPPPSNPGVYDWAEHLRRRGILVGISCDHAAGVRVLNAPSSGAWARLLERLRARFRGYLLDDGFALHDPGAGVISAMVLGERSAVPRAMNEAFVQTGNAHFLAASGMHVGWLALMGWGIARLFGLYYRTTAIFVGLLILSYVLLAEPRPSIMRAGIIGLVACVTVCQRGRYNALNSLSLAAVIILMLDPADLFRPAFQFSFTAVLALLHLCPNVAKTIAVLCMKRNLPRVARSFDSALQDIALALPDHRPLSWIASVRHKAGFLAAQLAALAFSAWFITAPLSCYHFNNFPPFGWLQTLILWVVAMPVTLFGFLTLLLGALLPSSGLVCGPLLKAGTDLMIALVELLARIPWTLIDGRSPSISWVLAVYAVMCLWVYKRAWISRKHGFKVCVLVLLLWWLVPPRWTRVEPGTMHVWMLDVGDGTSTVIELPDGKTMIYDCGTISSLDAGRVTSAFLKHRGIRRVDIAVVSHANFDHYGGIETLAKDFPIGRIVVNDQFEHFAPPRTGGWQFLQAMQRADIPVERLHGPGSLAGMGEVQAEILWPPPRSERVVPTANETSTVLRLTYQGRSVLFTGDIGEFAIGNLLTATDDQQNGVTLKANVLALPHHGSVVGNTHRFIEAVGPTIAVRSTGQRQALTTNGIESIVGDRAFHSTADMGCVHLVLKAGEVFAEALSP